jgi:hypothetical protein
VYCLSSLLVLPAFLLLPLLYQEAAEAAEGLEEVAEGPEKVEVFDEAEE